MIIFLSSSAHSISQQLQGATAKGPIGLYDSRDERAVEQAANLIQANVFVLNIFLVRLSTALVVIACLVMAFTPYVETAWVIVVSGFITAIVSIILDSIKSRRRFRGR